MAFAKLASAARTCISSGAMRVVRRREKLAGEGRDAEEESATVGAAEATAGTVVDSGGDDSARPMDGVAAEGGVYEARDQRRRS